MASDMQEAKRVLWYYEAKCVVAVHRRLGTEFGREPSPRMPKQVVSVPQPGYLHPKAKPPVNDQQVTEAEVQYISSGFCSRSKKINKTTARQAENSANSFKIFKAPLPPAAALNMPTKAKFATHTAVAFQTSRRRTVYTTNCG